MDASCDMDARVPECLISTYVEYLIPAKTPENISISQGLISTLSHSYGACTNTCTHTNTHHHTHIYIHTRTHRRHTQNAQGKRGGDSK